VATTVRQAPGACGFSGKNAPDTCPFRKAAFRAATRADPLFAEAWYNLSDLLDEQGRLELPSIVCAVRSEPRPTIPATSARNTPTSPAWSFLPSRAKISKERAAMTGNFSRDILLNTRIGWVH
jgi:hypothetical protein